MDWRVNFAPGAERDFSIILDHLAVAYVSLGDAPETALVRAISRVRAIRAGADRPGLSPVVGASRDDIGAGVRHVAFDRAIHRFAPNEAAKTITVVAVFLAGEDHHHKMALRLKKAVSKTRC